MKATENPSSVKLNNHSQVDRRQVKMLKWSQKVLKVWQPYHRCTILGKQEKMALLSPFHRLWRRHGKPRCSSFGAVKSVLINFSEVGHNIYDLKKGNVTS